MKNPRVAIIARLMACVASLGIQSINSLGQENTFIDIIRAYSNGQLGNESTPISDAKLDSIVLLKNQDNALPISDKKQHSWLSLIETGNVHCISLSSHSHEEVSNRLKSIKEDHESSEEPLVIVVTDASENMPPAIYDYSDALLYSWNSLESIQSDLVEVILGRKNPFGRLPYEILYPNSEHNAVDRSFLSTPNRVNNQQIQFPFGFGLSYSSYSYEEISLNKRILSETDDLRVSLKIFNRGPFPGTEQVQVYLIHPATGNSLPYHHLIASKRISLGTGQAGEVQFTISSGHMAQTMGNGLKKVLPGAYVITTASSSPVDRSVELGTPKPISTSFAIEFPTQEAQDSYSWNTR